MSSMNMNPLEVADRIGPHEYVATEPYKGCKLCGVGPGALVHNTHEVRNKPHLYVKSSTGFCTNCGLPEGAMVHHMHEKEAVHFFVRGKYAGGRVPCGIEGGDVKLTEVKGSVTCPICRESIDQEKALRFNDGRRRYDLLLPEWEDALVDVLTYGAKKYAPHQYLKSINTPDHDAMVEDRYASARRHLSAWKKGEKTDPESGQPHLAMAAWNMLCILTYDQRKTNAQR